MLLNINIKNDPAHKAHVYVKPGFILTDLYERNSWWIIRNPAWVKRAHEVMAMPNAKDHPFWEQMREGGPDPVLMDAAKVIFVNIK